MNWREKWKIIEEMPGGGQGKVYRVINNLEYIGHGNEVVTQLRNLTASIQHNAEAKLDRLFKELPQFIAMSKIENHFALKELHDQSKARDPVRAKMRMQREINAMKVLSELNHPNIIKLVDHDDNDLWFVSKFYPAGSLRRNGALFAGDALSVLNAVLPLLDGLSELHTRNLIHRDIKPDNIFLDSDDGLVLGDFGLIIPIDSEDPRHSDSYDNVGSRDWEPGWAYGARVEEVKPSFDIFSMGKMIWAMIAGRHMLRFWYFDKPEFNLETQYPDKPEMKLVNQFLKKVIVEDESNCLPTVEDMMNEISNLIEMLQSAVPEFDIEKRRVCPECNMGYFNLIADGSVDQVREFGLTPVHTRETFVFECPYCGLIQIFGGKNHKPIGWGEKIPKAESNFPGRPANFQNRKKSTT